MRWERLFEELELQGSDEAHLEHQALADDLRDGEWATTAWRSLLGGAPTLEIEGVGPVTMEVLAVSDDVLVGEDRVVAVSAIHGVTGGTRANAPKVLTHSWRVLLRDLIEEDGPRVRIVQRNAQVTVGDVVALGADFVRVDRRIIPIESISVVAGFNP